MGLVGITGKRSAVNRKLLLSSSDRVPCLIVDCANCANPHRLFPDIPFELFGSIYVIEVELLYALCDVLLHLPELTKPIGAKNVIITMFHELFHYQDEIENADVYAYAWELMAQHSSSYELLVGIHPKQLPVAAKYCTRIIEEHTWDTQSGASESLWTSSCGSSMTTGKRFARKNE